ncbi:hypothetical protein CXF59_07210 [Flavobacterium sp. ALD4]|uniref:MGDG synthase family glycosyltransferase n=1 Tax=Flavobacterium sp. ALD4 TaxID=2058314 RepID=UPI000C3267B9|nr:hypothetical protein [Flavobacterium sp. ALD4]PKH67687.1 hypothetical protein CXF59_07210 [Flavobacterium sp. ALD4]
MRINPNKILFLVPDGVGVRNFLYSDIIKNLKKKTAVCVWSSLPKEAFESVEKLHDITIEYQFSPLKRQSVGTKITTEAATYARLLRNSKLVDNPTILTNWNVKSNNFKQAIQKKVSQTIGFWASKKYNRILWLEKTSISFLSSSVLHRYRVQLKALQPDVVFITHQRVTALMPICIAAKNLNIKVVTAIYSWDNLPKARLAVDADYYLVWSEYMKKEMRLFYPEIPPEKCIVTGSPQFEFYTKKERIISREAFAARYNLDISKKWICFSGDDTITSPYDQLYLKDVVESITQSDFNNVAQVIFRRSPADFSNRYDEVLNTNPILIKAIDPIWKNYGTGWGSNFPQLGDVDLLVNLAFHCDVVLNLGSTMAHDFAVFDKPCLYFKYNHFNSDQWNVETIYKFQHFKSMGDLDAVVWITSKDCILKQLKLALQEPNEVAKDRKEWLRIVVQHPLELSCEQIAAVLLTAKIN